MDEHGVLGLGEHEVPRMGERRVLRMGSPRIGEQPLVISADCCSVLSKSSVTKLGGKHYSVREGM